MNRPNFKLIWALIFVFYALGDGTRANNEDRLRLIRADRARSVEERGKLIRILEGRVHLVQGDAFLFCDNARQIMDDELVILEGGVHIFDGKRDLLCDLVRYNGRTRTETAVGNVVLTMDSRILTTQQLIYNQEMETATSWGGVRIEDLIENTILTGREARYQRIEDYGWVQGSAIMTRVDTTSKDTIVVKGHTIEAWGDEKRVVVTDSVSIINGKLTATCRKAEYHAGNDSLVLYDLPLIVYDNQRMRGDTIHLMLDSLQFNGGYLAGRAEISWDDSLGENNLKGESIQVIASRDTLREILVIGRASSLYNVADSEEKNEGLNTITGDTILLVFDDKGQVVRVRVQSSPGQCVGIYTPKQKGFSKKNEASRSEK